MGEVIKFPIIQKVVLPETTAISRSNSTESTIADFKKKIKTDEGERPIQACLCEDSPKIITGGEIVVHVYGKKCKGIVTNILQRDNNYNVTKIAHTIPFLSGDDPLKFGEANFTYNTEKYD